MNDDSVKNNTLYDEFIKNIEPVKHIVTPVKMSSVEAAKLYEDKSLFFVFIDASHLYEAIKEDIIAWLPKVKSGGFIGGHDIDQTEEFNGVRRAVDELIGSKNVILYNVGWASWMHRVS
jgi:membrane-associated protease RseP (regulator of RpoE activity)